MIPASRLPILPGCSNSRGAKSIKLCTLLDKPSRRAPGITLQGGLFRLSQSATSSWSDYGLDYAELYRNLPYIGVLKPEIYE